MSLAGHCLAPSSSLPPLRSLLSSQTAQEQIQAALRALQRIYCPLRLPVAIAPPSHAAKAPSTTAAPVDSGYVSEDEDEDEDALAILSADTFERDFAVRWLTSLIGRVEELPCGEEVRAQLLDDAAFVLSSFSDVCGGVEEESLTREFCFGTRAGCEDIEVQLNDAPLTGADHTDVGLQSWGASIIFSELLCLCPKRFDLDDVKSHDLIVELGAGTGLVGLTVAKLLEQMPCSGAAVVATDYHAAVLDNLRTNIDVNFPQAGSRAPVQTMLLDWAAPSLAPPLDRPVRMLLAADVVYAPQHAVWLRDCAAQLLAPDGVFWLIMTVRQHGKFEGIAETVAAAFAEARRPESNGRMFTILEQEAIGKKKGIGRGDETGYILYRIGWA